MLARLQRHSRILIAGAGGGFDVYAGLPLYVALRAAGSEVFLANLTLHLPGLSTDRRCLAPHVAPSRRGRRRAATDYFPERTLAAVAGPRPATRDGVRVREGRRAAAARRVPAPGRAPGDRRGRAGRRRHRHPDARRRGGARHAGGGHDQPGGGRRLSTVPSGSSPVSASASTPTTASATRTCWRTSPRSTATAATWARSRCRRR